MFTVCEKVFFYYITIILIVYIIFINMSVIKCDVLFVFIQDKLFINIYNILIYLVN